MGGEDSLIEIACPSVNAPCILLWHVPLVIPSDLQGLMSFVLTLLAGSTAGFPLHFRAVCALPLVQGTCDSCLCCPALGNALPWHLLGVPGVVLGVGG